MAISASSVWETRTTGADTNSGGFVAGAAGTDRSQSDAAFASGVSLTVDATTNTDVAPDGYSPVAADVGNLIQITTTGTGAAFTVGFYEIKSIQSGKWRLDRSPAATSSTGATWALGGALATIGKATAAAVASNRIYVKAGSGYTITASMALAAGAMPTATVPSGMVIGYTTTRGDGGRPAITYATNASILGFNVSGQGWRIENFDINCSSLATSRGVNLAAAWVTVRNVKVRNFTFAAFNFGSNYGRVEECEATGGTSAATAAIATGSFTANVALRNHVHDNVCTGIVLYQACVATSNLITNNSGASSDGIACQNSCVITSNTIYKSGRHGINNTITTTAGSSWKSNILAENGGYGLVGASAAGQPALPDFDGNAFYSNTSGTRNNADDTVTNPVNGVAPYTNTLDEILTADPFVNAASGDFRLNTTAGGGAQCRAMGLPQSWPGNTLTLGYPDMGAVQSQATGGGGGGIGSLVGGGLVA